MPTPQTLKEQVDHARDAFLGSLSEENQQIVAGAFERLLKSDVTDNAKTVGDTAPNFTLPNSKGEAIKLTDLLKKGPVVINFFRGGWCPFCNLEFKALHDQLAAIKDLKATLVGISPETPDATQETKSKFNLAFEVLSDQGNIVAREYGLVMKVDDQLLPLYAEWGIDVPAANGDDSYELPVPATYIIDTQGIIRSAFVEKDYTQRMEPAEIVSALEKL